MTRVLFSKSAMRKALVFSFAVHAALFGVARPLALRPARAAPAPEAPSDRFAGTTAELPFADPSGAVYDVSIDTPPSHPAPPPAPSPVEAAPVPVVAAPTATAAPLATASAPPRPPRRPRRPRKEAGEGEAQDKGASAPSTGADQGPSRPAHAAGHGSGGSGGAAGPFGPEGPTTTRSLGRAFARTIPLASQADPTWGEVPLGDAGKLEVVVHVDAEGHVLSFETRGPIPPRTLSNLLQNTMVFLKAGTFAIQGGELHEGTEVLEIRATVSQVPVAAFEQGGPISLSNPDPGTASFTQANGRRVDVKIRVLKVEVR